MLLGYGARQHETGTHKGQRQNILLSQAIREAEATIHFLQRSYRFVMDTALLNLLPTTNLQTQTRAGASLTPTYHVSAFSQAETSTLFDSSIEQSFAEAFQALENSSATEGWRLEREPEPLLLDTSIFIPDFALTRGNRRIYVEILGFWTPSYRQTPAVAGTR
jgi:predicted nuclease of restriction endonuclease-like RecB superfamily